MVGPSSASRRQPLTFDQEARPPLSDLHSGFVALVPRIEQHGRIYFRHVRCQHQKAELLQEMRSLGWQWFVRLNQRGKNVNEFVTVFVGLLARAVNSGRRLTGLAKAKDVMNLATHKRHGFGVESLEVCWRHATHEPLFSAPHGQVLQDALEERLRDNTVTPVLDQVQFRIDWPAWLATLTASVG